MSSGIKWLAVVWVAMWASQGVYADAFERLLRKSALDAGFARASDLYQNPHESLVPLGKTLFASKSLSLNGNIACQTCHLDQFGSADGLPLAAAIGGHGEGLERLKSGARLLPRSSLPLWGLGGKGFDVFFWDGKVDFANGVRRSQFGRDIPGNDPLVVAVHLLVVEIREMLDDDAQVEQLKSESVSAAMRVYRLVVEKLTRDEASTMQQLAQIRSKQVSELEFLDVAEALAAFIRSKFRIRETRFERFIFDKESLKKEEVRGGVLFFGKGRCVTCHAGPYFSDFGFHVVPFPQLGFGKNGFGIDYGRYNVSFLPEDLYRFRTPPLFNVEKTAPYGHSGSLATLEDAVIAHFDPLRYFEVSRLDERDRHYLFRRLTMSDADAVGYLSEKEVSEVVRFLRTLSF